MDDEGFLGALERCELPPEEFRHAAHLRAGYLYLRKGVFEEALDRIRHSLGRYVAHLGKAQVYDDAMTAAYMSIIHRRIAEPGDADGWTAFARDNPDLFSTRL